MPRGAKRDNFETKLRHFRDPRSFCSINGHEYLYGKDVEPRRREVYERDHGICQMRAEDGDSPVDCDLFALWDDGEMHHIQGGLVGRCDCLHNVQWVCKPCHRASHVRPKWSSQQAVKV